MSFLFNPSKPFHFPAGLSYEEQCAHSAELDSWLGLDVEANEKKIQAELLKNPVSDQLWTSVPTKTFLTPYLEIHEMLTRLPLQKNQTIVDLGAGYGRMGIAIGYFFPEIHFLGYEIVQARVSSAQRCFQKMNYTNAQIVCVDLSRSDFKPAVAEYYFIYDYGTRAAIEKTILDLRDLPKPFTVIARGRASRDCIERQHPWLSGIISPEHCGNYSIYRT